MQPAGSSWRLQFHKAGQGPVCQARAAADATTAERGSSILRPSAWGGPTYRGWGQNEVSFVCDSVNRKKLQDKMCKLVAVCPCCHLKGKVMINVDHGKEVLMLAASRVLFWSTGMNGLQSWRALQSPQLFAAAGLNSFQMAWWGAEKLSAKSSK